jgi:hypothetical protein
VWAPSGGGTELIIEGQIVGDPGVITNSASSLRPRAFIDNQPCNLTANPSVFISDRELRCIAPPGLGVNRRIVVDVGVSRSLDNTTCTFVAPTLQPPRSPIQLNRTGRSLTVAGMNLFPDTRDIQMLCRVLLRRSNSQVDRVTSTSLRSVLEGVQQAQRTFLYQAKLAVRSSSDLDAQLQVSNNGGESWANTSFPVTILDVVCRAGAQLQVSSKSSCCSGYQGRSLLGHECANQGRRGCGGCRCSYTYPNPRCQHLKNSRLCWGIQSHRHDCSSRRVKVRDRCAHHAKRYKRLYLMLRIRCRLPAPE